MPIESYFKFNATVKENALQRLSYFIFLYRYLINK